MRRILRLMALAAAALGFVALTIIAARVYQQPVTGDWQLRGASEKSGVRMELKRVTLRPWSEPLPNASLDEWIRSTDRRPSLTKCYLYLEFGVQVDGKPLRELPEERVRFLGPVDVRYDGRRIISSGSVAVYGYSDRNSTEYLWYEVTPWMRGFGNGKLNITHHVTLDAGETVAFDFPIAVE